MRTGTLFFLTLTVLIVFYLLGYFLDPTVRNPAHDPFKEYADSPDTYYQKHRIERDNAPLHGLATLRSYPPIGQQSATLYSYPSGKSPSSYGTNPTVQKPHPNTVPSYPATIGQQPPSAPPYPTSGQQSSTMPSYPSTGQQVGAVPLRPTVGSPGVPAIGQISNQPNPVTNIYMEMFMTNTVVNPENPAIPQAPATPQGGMPPAPVSAEGTQPEAAPTGAPHIRDSDRLPPWAMPEN